MRYLPVDRYVRTPSQYQSGQHANNFAHVPLLIKKAVVRSRFYWAINLNSAQYKPIQPLETACKFTNLLYRNNHRKSRHTTCGCIAPQAVIAFYNLYTITFKSVMRARALNSDPIRAKNRLTTQRLYAQGQGQSATGHYRRS